MPELPTGIRMLRPDLEGLPPLEPVVAALPSAYCMRTYQPGDEAAWTALMNTGDMGEWDVEKTRQQLTGLAFPQFDPAGLFLVVHRPQQQVVGSACAWLADPTEREQGILHMVCVLPEHRRKRLSYAPCLAVLHRFRERGLQRVYLNTSSERLGAVKVYLELGFQPVYQRPGHPDQWQAIVATLGWSQSLAPVVEERPA